MRQMCKRLMVLFGALMCGTACRAQCEPSGTWISGGDVSGVDGEIRASMLWDRDGPGPEPELWVVGGEFEVAGGVPAKNVAAWDGKEWHAFGAGPNRGVWSLAVFEGQLIAGSRYQMEGGVETDAVSAWDGSEWRPMGEGFSSSFGLVIVSSLIVVDDVLIAAGNFTRSGASTVRGIARWDGNGWIEMGEGFTLRAGTASVRGTMVFDGELLVGGSLDRSGSVSLRHLARWDGNSWQPFGSDLPDGSGLSTLGSFRGQLVVGGGDLLARWDGSAWRYFGDSLEYPGFGSITVQSLCELDGSLIVGGFFTTVNGLPSRGLARWDGSWMHRMGVGTDGYVNTLASRDGTLLVGGQFRLIDSDVPARHAAAWDGSEWSTVGSGTSDRVLTAAMHDGDLVVGGDFLSMGGAAANRIARFRNGEWEALGSGFNNVVNAVCEFRGELIAAGGFTQSGGFNVNTIARWNNGWQQLGALVPPGGEVRALLVHNNELYAAGGFDWHGYSALNIARWDGTRWRAMNGLVGVHSLAVYNGEVVAGLSTSGVRAWNGSAWRTLGSDFSMPSTSPTVHMLTVFQGELVAGGVFSRAGGTPASGIASWNGSAWRALGAGVGYPDSSYGRTYAMAVVQDLLVVGGDFVLAGGAPANRVASWNGTEWRALDSGVNRPVRAMLNTAGGVVTGGEFTLAGGEASAYLATWAPPVPFCAADVDCSGSVNSQDFFAFVLAFFDDAPPEWADFNADGAVNSLDFFEYLTAFFGEC